jgi:hypothetical protein
MQAPKCWFEAESTTFDVEKWRGAYLPLLTARRGSMAALAYKEAPRGEPQRSVVERTMDALATFLMRQELRVIARNQDARATITSVAQPSNTNDRSSINP